MNYLLDSVVLIDHLNGRDAATAFIEHSGPDSAISVITRAEILTGFDEPQAVEVRAFLDRFALLGIDGPVADLAAALRRNNHWKLPDAFQAALAQVHNLRLVTRNTRDFPPKRHAFVLVPYR